MEKSWITNISLIVSKIDLLDISVKKRRVILGKQIKTIVLVDIKAINKKRFVQMHAFFAINYKIWL